MNKNIIKKSLAEAKKYLKEDSGHGILHVKNMFKIANYLVKKEKLQGKVDKELVKLAIIFHDFGRMGYLSNKNIDDHDTKSAIFARKYLKKLGYTKAEEVARMIDKHDLKGRTLTLEEKIFYDADVLDVLGAVGIGRTFTFGGRIERDLNGSMKRLIWKSFRNKLSTKTAKKLAIRRRKFIREFIKQYNKEVKLND